MKVLVATLALVLLVPSDGTANESTSTLWAVDSEYDQAMEQGNKLALRAAELLRATDLGRVKRLPRQRARRETALQAVAAYERASLHAPQQAEPHFRAAATLHALLLEPTQTPIDQAAALSAIDHWTHFERLAPRDPRMVDVLFHRSLTQTKLGGEVRYQQGLADYVKRLQLIPPDAHAALALTLSNSAELTMAIGDLTRAIELYEESLVHKPGESLYGFGLAVALDRDGQTRRARETMRHYLPRDPRHRFSRLSEDGVFFIPDGDVHYYRALAHESVGEWDHAAAEYRRYLDLQGSSRYAQRARDNLRLLTQNATPARRLPIPKPTGAWGRDS